MMLFMSLSAVQSTSEVCLYVPSVLVDSLCVCDRGRLSPRRTCCHHLHWLTMTSLDVV